MSTKDNKGKEPIFFHVKRTTLILQILSILKLA